MDKKLNLPKIPKKRAKRLWVLAAFLMLIVILLIGWLLMREPAKSELGPKDNQNNDTAGILVEPKLTTEELLTGLDHVWEIAFLPTGELIFNERSGQVSTVQNGQKKQIADIDDVRSQGEGGLLGLAVDSEFAKNRYIYTCYNSTKGGPDVRVVRWKLANDLSNLSDRKDIITGMPANTSGRHSGCRLVFGPDGYLWVGTGDAARGANPQDPKNLGGKILRVDRDGNAPADNPSLGVGFDKRIYSYGHRNTQGMAFFKAPINGVLGLTVEHGPGKDDEINPLVPGNFGWDPTPGDYNESVPMTNKDKFPAAIEAIWKSGTPTLAPSGATMLYGDQWGLWNGALAVAMLKASHLRIIQLDESGQLKSETEVLKDFGRLRTVVPGPDGHLYIGTDNGEKDKIIKVIPRLTD